MAGAICGIYNYGLDKARASLEFGIGSMLNAFSSGRDKNIYLADDNKIAFGYIAGEGARNGCSFISNENKAICLVSKGKIFNGRGFIDSLKGKGHVFRESPDNEVLAHLYEEEDTDCFNSIDAEIVSALWDANKNKLILARDKLGTKSIYYASVDGKIIFASEIKGILAYPGFNPEVNEKTLFYYLSLEYSPAPFTVFEGVHKVMPGFLIEFDSRGSKSERQYWDLPSSDGKGEILDQEATEKIRFLLSDAVKKRISFDEPIGCFLSGGKDSTSILALMSKFIDPGSISTFTIGFKPSNKGAVRLPEDLLAAKEVSGAFGTKHNEIIVSSRDVLKTLPFIAEQMDDLFSLPCVFYGHLISRFVKEKGVQIVLSGDGEEEIFFGYEGILRFYNIVMSAPMVFLKMVPKEMLNRAYSLAGGSGSLMNRNGFTANILESIRRLSRGQEMYWGNAMPFTQADRTGFFSEGFVERCGGLDPFDAAGGVPSGLYRKKYNSSLFDKMVYTDIKGWLAERYLMRIDRTASANNIEVRLPFLDASLVDFVIGIPERTRFRKQTSYLFNKSINGLIPSWVLNRKKIIFPGPMQLWQGNEFIPLAKDTVLCSGILKRGYFDRDKIEKTFAEHMSGRRNNLYRILTLYFLSIWFDRWIDKRANR